MYYEYDISGGFKVRFKEETKLVAQWIAVRAIKKGRWTGKIDTTSRLIYFDDLYLTKTEAIICMAFGLPYSSMKESIIGE